MKPDFDHTGNQANLIYMEPSNALLIVLTVAVLALSMFTFINNLSPEQAILEETENNEKATVGLVLMEQPNNNAENAAKVELIVIGDFNGV